MCVRICMSSWRLVIFIRKIPFVPALVAHCLRTSVLTFLSEVAKVVSPHQEYHTQFSSLNIAQHISNCS